MITYREPNGAVVTFVHVPGCGGRWWRWKVTRARKVLEDHWGVKDGVDQAHRPASKAPAASDRVFAFARNPYDRLVGVWLHKHPDGTVFDFKRWCAEVLPALEPRVDDADTVHYCPQRAFIDADGVEVERLEDAGAPTVYAHEYWYTDATKAIVDRVYAADFALWGKQQGGA